MFKVSFLLTIYVMGILLVPGITPANLSKSIVNEYDLLPSLAGGISKK